MRELPWYDNLAWHAAGNVAALGTCVIILSGCVTNNVVSTGISDARTNVMSGGGSVAIFPFDGESKEAVTAMLEHAATEANTTKRSSVRLVDRQNAEKLKEELKINKDGEPDKSSAKKQGRLLQADYILIGRIHAASVKSTKSSYQIAECTAYENNNKFFKKCTATTPKTVTCTDTIARVSVQPRLIKTNNGEIVYSKIHEGEAVDRYCDNAGTALPEAALKANAAVEAAREIGRDLWAYKYTINAAIKQSSEGLTGQSREDFESAMAFARGGRLDRTCQTMKSLVGRGVQTVAVLYNHAICEESDNKPEAALNIMESLDQSLRAPDPLISEALLRLRSRVNTRGNSPAARMVQRP